MSPAGLRALLAIVEHGTFAAAADALGYAQSTVSQQLSTLEAATGGPLLDRSVGPGRATLTPLGRVVERHARRVLHELEVAEHAIEDHRQGRGRLTIGTFQAVTTALLPTVIRTLLAEEATRDIELVESEDDRPDLDGLDLCFFDAPPAFPDQGVLVTSDHRVLLAPEGTFAPGPVDPKQLAGRPFVALPATCDQARLEQELESIGVRPRIVFRTAENHALAAMVQAGLGCTILPALSTPTVPVSGITIHPLDPTLAKRPIYAQWRGTPSPLAQRAVDLAVATAAALQHPEPPTLNTR